uniref:Uncharacterized protein n=1 Tax=Leptobrachium leishanense TaxID=445787 RepID=A0A8C5Q455_9ANUR
MNPDTARDPLSQRILDLTLEMIFLLTGEVPIRCEDVTVYLSMEEWEYVERHKELYEDVMMEDHQPVITLVDNPVSGEVHNPLSLSDCETGNITHNEESYLNKATTGQAESATYTKEQSLAFGDRHVTEKDIYPITDHSQRENTLPDIEEPASCEKENLTNTNMYEPPEHTQTEYIPDNFAKSLKTNTHPVEINHSESLIGSRKPDHRIYYTDLVNYNSYYNGNVSLSCNVEQSTYSESDLVIHGTNCRVEPLFSKDCCENSTPESALKQQHIPTEEQSFSCPMCGKTFADSIALKNHQRIHTGKKTFNCTECGKCFNHASHLAIHNRIHTGEKPYKCDECGKCFTQTSSLATHKMIHKGEKLFKCTDCGKCFTLASHLAVHKRSHTGEKPFKCPECGKCFTHTSNLAAHKRIHTGEKPFKCPECGKCFNHASYLAKHKMIHTGEKPFSCSECGKCFTQASHFGRHKKIHTGEKPFYCTECGKCFAHSSHLVTHKKIHTEEKTFNCEDCGKCFTSAKSLARHRMIHKVEK